MGHLAEERYRRILEIVRTRGEIVISDASQELKVSDMTIRRDLQRMEEQGLVVRVHGGAIPVESARFGDRMTKNAPGKRKAALKLAPHLPKVGSIYLDGSTTILNLAEELRGCNHLVVATNNIEAFKRIVAVPGVEGLLIGGRLDMRTDNMVGTLATRSLDALAFDAAFFSAWGIDPQMGPMEMTLEDAEIKELVARRSGQVYIAVDEEKLGKIAAGAWNPAQAHATLSTDLVATDPRLDPYRNRFPVLL